MALVRRPSRHCHRASHSVQCDLNLVGTALRLTSLRMDAAACGGGDGECHDDDVIQGISSLGWLEELHVSYFEVECANMAATLQRLHRLRALVGNN